MNDVVHLCGPHCVARTVCDRSCTPVSVAGTVSDSNSERCCTPVSVAGTQGTVHERCRPLLSVDRTVCECCCTPLRATRSLCELLYVSVVRTVFERGCTPVSMARSICARNCKLLCVARTVYER
jgi:hypothetical protein